MARTGWNYPCAARETHAGLALYRNSHSCYIVKLTISPYQIWDMRYEVDIHYALLLNVICRSQTVGVPPDWTLAHSPQPTSQNWILLPVKLPIPPSSQQPAALGTATLLLSHGEHSWKHVRDKGIWSSAAVLQNTACLHNYPDIQNILSIKHQNKHKHRSTVLDVAAV